MDGVSALIKLTFQWSMAENKQVQPINRRNRDWDGGFPWRSQRSLYQENANVSTYPFRASITTFAVLGR